MSVTLVETSLRAFSKGVHLGGQVHDLPETHVGFNPLKSTGGGFKKFCMWNSFTYQAPVPPKI